jgi:hypothetical protein
MPASERQPGTNHDVPDPAASYGREKPEAEAGMGRLDNNDDAVPANAPDKEEAAVGNRQPLRQINADDELDERDDKRVSDRPIDTHPGTEQPDHSLLDEEPRGEDLAPMDIHDPRRRRHPRTEGRGGTP